MKSRVNDCTDAYLHFIQSGKQEVNREAILEAMNWLGSHGKSNPESRVPVFLASVQTYGCPAFHQRLRQCRSVYSVVAVVAHSLWFLECYKRGFLLVATLTRLSQVWILLPIGKKKWKRKKFLVDLIIFRSKK